MHPPAVLRLSHVVCVKHVARSTCSVYGFYYSHKHCFHFASFRLALVEERSFFPYFAAAERTAQECYIR